MKIVVNKIIHILSIAIIILSLQGCTNNKQGEPRDLEFEVVIDKMENTDVVASLFYENHIDKTIKGYRTYLWKDKKITRSKKEFVPIYASMRYSTYPKKSLQKLKKQLETNGNSSELDKAYIYYGNTSEYELFIFRDYDTNDWTLHFLMDKGLKSIIINNNEKEYISGCQIDTDTVYIYSNKIYEINMTNLSVNKLVIPKKEPFHFNTDWSFIQNDTIYITSYDSNRIGLYQYNLKTGVSETFFNDDKQILQIENFFPYNDGFIALCTESETFKPVLKYFDNKFNLVDSKYINIKSEHNNVTAYEDGRYFYLYDNKIYGKMRVDGRHIDEIVVIDTDSADLLYQAELDHKRKNIIMTDIRFQTFENEKLVDLN